MEDIARSFKEGIHKNEEQDPVESPAMHERRTEMREYSQNKFDRYEKIFRSVAETFPEGDWCSIIKDLYWRCDFEEDDCKCCGGWDEFVPYLALIVEKYLKENPQESVAGVIRLLLGRAYRETKTIDLGGCCDRPKNSH